MSIHSRLMLLSAWLIALSAVPAQAQPIPPFFGSGTVAFDPQVDTVQSGVELVTHATVSQDLKYVTISAQPTLSKLQALKTYAFSTVNQAGGGQGFVGGIGGAASGGIVSNAPAARSAPSATQIDRTAKASILTRQGMFLVKRLD